MDVAISFKNKIALATVCLSAVMLGLEITSVPSILPTLKNVLPADFKQLQWIMKRIYDRDVYSVSGYGGVG